MGDGRGWGAGGEEREREGLWALSLSRALSLSLLNFFKRRFLPVSDTCRERSAGERGTYTHSHTVTLY